MTLRSAACRFFLISRIYSVADTVITVSAIILSCIAGGLSAQLSDDHARQERVQTITICAICAAILQAISKTFSLASSAERCRTISRDLNRLDKDFTNGTITAEKRDSRYASIQKRVPVGTCMWLR